LGRSVKGDVVVVPFPFFGLNPSQETPGLGGSCIRRKRSPALSDNQPASQRQLCNPTRGQGFRDRGSQTKKQCEAQPSVYSRSTHRPVQSGPSKRREGKRSDSKNRRDCAALNGELSDSDPVTDSPCPQLYTTKGWALLVPKIHRIGVTLPVIVAYLRNCANTASASCVWNYQIRHSRGQYTSIAVYIPRSQHFLIFKDASNRGKTPPGEDAQSNM